MKATGFVRQVDNLGRMVIPIEVRRQLGIETGDGMEVLVDGDSIVLVKYRPGCVFCGEPEGTVGFRGKVLCAGCVTALSDQQRAAYPSATIP